MATLNGEWSLKTTNTGTTASYKIGTKEVVKLTNLNSNVKVDETDKSLLTGVTVTEDDSAGNKITLSESALGTANIAFTSSTYKLELDDAIPQTVEIKNPELTVASGKATVKGTLTKAYTLSANGKTVTYSPQKDNQELATVTGLDTTKASAANVELGDDTITLKADALKQGKASLTLKNGAAYTLALDDVAPPTSTVTAVDYKSGTATIKGTVDTAGYYVAPDGKSVNYVKKTTSAGTLATVKGLNAELDQSAISTEQDADGSYNINITSGLLVDQKDVTISSTNGYRLKLDSAVSKPSAQNEWAVKGTVATYKQVQPAYYDDLGTKIAYVKEADVQTYATVKGLANNLTAEGTSLKDSNGAVATLSGKVITLKSGALTTTNVTLDGDGYSLKLDPSDTNITPPKVDTSTAPTWSVSKTTATYKGKTTAGWGQKDAQTIAYSKAATATVLATVDNLKTGLKPADLNNSGSEYYIAVDNTDGAGKITLPPTVLDGKNVTVTPGDGFKYTPALGTGVEQEAKEAHTWEKPAEGTTTAKLYKGTTDYYTVSGQTAVYHAADKGSKVATIQNLAEGLTAEDLNEHTTISEYDNKAKAYTVKLSEELFGGKTITITGTGYKLGTVDDYSVTTGLTTWEKDNDTTATFYEYNSEGYAPDAKGTQIVYTPARKGATLGTVTGLKKGFVVAEDGTIDGLAGYATETVVSEETVVDGVKIPAKVIPAKTIVITKPVVGNDPIVLTSSYGYSLAVGEGLTDSTTPTQSWDVKSNAAVYTLTTPAGYSLSEENTVFTPTKASKITVTLTGLGTTNVEEIKDGIDVKDAEKVMTLKESVLGKNNVTAKGDYTLALDEDVDPPGFGTMTWNMTKKGTAVLNADVTTAGYTAGGKTIAYTEQEDAKELATVSGLTNIANADATEVKNDGKAGLKASTDGTITVGQAVLGTSKVSVKGDGYSLALGSDVPTGYATAENEWILKGTTATLQSYKKGFYTIDEKTGAIAFTKDTKATVHATISGLAKITDANKETVAASISLEGDTITLGADALGTSTVKLKNGKDSEGVATSYKLALGGDVPTETKKVTEWVSNGTKITYQNYDKGFYTLSGSDITFTKDKNVKALLTVSGNGLVSGATVAQFDEDNGLIYLGKEQLADTKNKSTVTLKTSAGYEDYKLKLVDSGSNAVETPDPETSTNWETSNDNKSAIYSQTVDDEQFLCDGTTITYYKEGADVKLATLTGLNPDGAYNFNNVTVENGVITLTEDILQTSDFASAKIAVKEKGYTLAIDDSVATPKHGTPKWDLTTVKTKGTATYNDTVTEGYTVNEKDKRSITYSAEKTTNTLTTLSGLNKNYTVNTEATPAAQATAAGLSVDAETGVITLSNRDLLTTSKVTLKNASGQDYTLAVNESLAPTDLKPETAVWTLKGTKASLNLGKSAGYELDTKSKTATTVNYVKQDASTVIATLEGLGKNVKLQDGKLGTLTKVGKTQEFTEGVFMRAGNEIALTQDVLGTTDVKLTNTDGYSYTIADENFTKSTTGDLIWSNDPTKGTATLSQTTTEGWELQNDNTLLKYTANKVNATIATLSGLNKEFKGDIDEAVSVDGKTITVNKADLLGTSKVTIKNADKNNEYVLALTEDKEEIPQDGDERTGWLTSGTKATYKTYKQAYYSIDKGAIVYNKAVDVKNSTVAEVSGIKKDEDISDCVDGNVITLGAGQLENKNVTLKNTKDLGNYTLALGSDAKKATLADTAKWTTKSGTASLVGSVSTGYTASSDGLKLTYSNKETTPAIAIIKGLETDLTGEVSTADTTITLSKSQLKPKVTVDGKETFDFDFDADYSGTITGSATADTITAGGDNVSIGTAKGNDVITANGASVSILAGDGNDTIDVTGSAAFVNAGKGDDSIKSSGQANIFFYANGDGNDVIANFAPAKDKIKTNGTLVSVKQEGSDAVITIGKTNALGTITLTGKGTSADSIIIIDNKDNEIAHPSASSDVLLADDNYSMNAAALTDITEPFKASYTPYDFESNLDLVKKDSFASAVTYASDDK